MSTEIWKDIEGFPRYQVSNTGKVRKINKHRPPNILTPNVIRGGYSVIRMQRDGKQYGRMLHRLMFEAFVEPIPDGVEIHHIDFDPSNNNLNNLRMATPQENVRYTRNAGRSNQVRGEGQGNSKHKEHQVAATKFLLEKGLSQKRTSDITRMSYDSVRKVAQGRQWTHVSPY